MKASHLIAATLALAVGSIVLHGQSSASIDLTTVFTPPATYNPNSYAFSLGGYNGVDPLKSVTLTFDVLSPGYVFEWDNDNESTASAYVLLSNASSALSIGGYKADLGLNGTWENVNHVLSGQPLGESEVNATNKPDAGGADYFRYDIVAGKPYASYVLTITDEDVLRAFSSGKVDLSFSSVLSSFGGSSASYIVTNATNPGATLVVSEAFVAVPEPSTYALLLGVGTLGLVGYRRFRRK